MYLHIDERLYILKRGLGVKHLSIILAILCLSMMASAQMADTLKEAVVKKAKMKWVPVYRDKHHSLVANTVAYDDKRVFNIGGYNQEYTEHKISQIINGRMQDCPLVYPGGDLT